MKVDVCLDVTAWATVDLDTGEVSRLYTQGYNIAESSGPHFATDGQTPGDVTSEADAKAALRAFNFASLPKVIEIDE